MALSRWASALIAITISARVSSFSLTEKVTNGCYGNGNLNRDFLYPTCSPGQMMVIKYIKMGAKREDTGCRPEATNEDANAHKALCCTYEEATDKYCFLDFNTSNIIAESCLGRSQCAPTRIRVGRIMAIGSCHTDYLNYTNYMMMSYYCVPDGIRIDENENGNRISRSAYLYSLGYPSSTMMQRSSKQSGVCSIFGAACQTRIKVSILDLDLTETIGSCSGTLTINDGSDVTTINCNQNTRFVNKDSYVSSSTFLTLDIENPSIGGLFFLEFDSDDGSNITLACGSSALTSSPISCTTSMTTSTIVATDSSTVTTTHDETTDEKLSNVNTEDYKTMAYVFMALFLLALVVICVLVVLVCYFKGWNPLNKRNKISGIETRMTSEGGTSVPEDGTS